MAQIISTDWTQKILRIAQIGGFLALLGILTPPTGIIESDRVWFLWYFGFWFSSAGGRTDSGFVDKFWGSPWDDKYMIIGIIAIVLLIIAMILMFNSANQAKYEENKSIAVGMSLLGGILAIVGPAAYYFYLENEFPPGYWSVYDPSFGFYLPIVAGIIGILCAIAAGYAFSLESKAVAAEVAPYQPAPYKPATDTQVDVQSQQERPNFCKYCGTKLIGTYCQECGAKAEP